MPNRTLTRKQATEWLKSDGRGEGGADLFAPLCEYGFRIIYYHSPDDKKSFFPGEYFPFLQFSGELLLPDKSGQVQPTWPCSEEENSIAMGIERLRDLLGEFKKTEPNSDLVVIMGSPTEESASKSFTLCDRGAKTWFNLPAELQSNEVAARFQRRSIREFVDFMFFLEKLP